MIKRFVLVVSIVLLLSVVGFGAYRTAQDFSTFLSPTAETATQGTLQSSTVPQVDDSADAPATHRPVVVTYVDPNMGQTRLQSVGEEAPAIDERYYVAVSYVDEVDESVDETGAPAAETKRLIVTASLGNRTGPPARVEPQSLALLDETGQRFPPVVEETGDASDLLGASVTTDESVYGFVTFDVPADVAPVALQWCPHAASCDRVVQAPLP